jgi:hypothetical protein
MTLRWIAGSLRMGSGHYVSHLPYLQRKEEKQITRSDPFPSSCRLAADLLLFLKDIAESVDG